MDPGEQTTGTRDEHYNLVSVLYHALHGAETIEIYAMDAEAAGDEQLADFFREAHGIQVDLAERAKELLGIEGATPGMGEEVPPTDVVPGDVGVTTDLPPTPQGAPGDVEDVERGVAEPPPPGGEPVEAAPPRETVTPEGEAAVPPDAPRTPEPPPRTGEAPPSPSEAPPADVSAGGTREAPPGPSAPPADEPEGGTREAPPPGEERPESRGEAASTDTPREDPPPGEERPERRTP